MAAAATALALGSAAAGGVATAHHERPVVGTIWYSDGANHKWGPPGTFITVYVTQAKPNTPYTLRYAARPEGTGGLPPSCTVRAAILDPNVPVRWTNSSGFIGNTTAAVNLPTGNHQLCFWEEAPTGSVTSSVHFTVV